MKLLKSKDQQASAGLPPSHREWWDLGDNYEIYVEISGGECGFGIHAPEKSITKEVAKYLDVDTNLENIKFGGKSEGRELYLTYGIDCFVLNYTKPKQYKELLKKIEDIVEKKFKTK